MDLLRAGPRPLRRARDPCGGEGRHRALDAVRRFADDPMLDDKPVAQWDVAGLLKLMWETWNNVFGRTLGRCRTVTGSRGRATGAMNGRTRHRSPATTPIGHSILLARLLAAVSAPQADDVNRMKLELRRLHLRGTRPHRTAQRSWQVRGLRGRSPAPSSHGVKW